RTPPGTRTRWRSPPTGASSGAGRSSRSAPTTTRTSAACRSLHSADAGASWLRGREVVEQWHGGLLLVDALGLDLGLEVPPQPEDLVVEGEAVVVGSGAGD